ncbi:MAG TPA: rRNA maturation RNase YbeY [Verrucomicrobiae bacterium]|nr:rRNA maturation RNase YbeY [Verrucomicrobiae bacterium]
MRRTLGLRNRQRVRLVDTRLLRRIARWALEEQFHAADYELGVHLVTAAEMARVNESFLDHEGSTDVITFDHREASGATSRVPSRRPRPSLRGPTPGKASRETGPAAHEPGGRARRSARAALDTPDRRARSDAPYHPFALQGRPAPKHSGGSVHGEIFLCLDDAVAQARQFGTGWQSELARYLLHGLLHLHGFDDSTPRARRRMKRQENRLLRLAQRQFSLRRLARPRRL